MLLFFALFIPTAVGYQVCGKICINVYSTFKIAFPVMFTNVSLVLPLLALLQSHISFTAKSVLEEVVDFVP